MRDTLNPAPLMLPSDQQFKDYCKMYDIKNTSRVVLYDNKVGHPYGASRAYWIFRVFGHRNASILNGGLKKWVDEGRPVESREAVEEDFQY